MFHKKSKINILKSAHICKFCSEIFKFFGENICKRRLKNNIKINCIFCNEIHIMPYGKFKVNKSMEEILKFEVDLIKQTPSYESCKKKNRRRQINCMGN